MGAAHPSTARKVRRCSANIKFFASAQSRSNCRISTDAGARPSDCRDPRTVVSSRLRLSVNRRYIRLGALLVVVMTAAGCGASRAYREGDAAMKSGNLDQAVAYYRTAAQANPDNPNYQIALTRAMQAASRSHFDKAKAFEDQNQIE